MLFRSNREKIDFVKNNFKGVVFMKNILTALLLVFVLIFQSGRVYGEGTPQSLVILGDSIASGYGLAEYTAGNNYSAPLSFGNLLGAEYESYKNFAVDGRTSAQLLSVLEDPSEEIAKALADADEIVISIGGNDFLQPMISAVKLAALSAAFGDGELLSSIFNGEFKIDMAGEFSDKLITAALDAAKEVDIGMIAENIRKCVEAVRRINPTAEIVLLTVYDPFSGNALFRAASEVAEERLAVLNGQISAIDEVTVADVYSAFKGQAAAFTNINCLDIHPNADGHYKIYELLTHTAKREIERVAA